MRADRDFSSRYTLEENLGAGNMGSVWRGQQRALGRPVAIKFMARELVGTDEYRERFTAEARAVARLIHSHVTAVFDSGVAGGVPFIVTELVEGESLSKLLETPGLLAADAKMQVATQVLSALEAIHALGILHRDIKPSNVMVTRAPLLNAKVLDFGIAKKLGEERGITEIGVVLGSPAYMSPEQACGQRLTVASDLYALTILIYEMVLGTPPFVASTALETIQLRITHDAHVPADLVPSLADLLVRGLSRDASRRLTTAAAYRAALDRAVADVRAAGGFTPRGHTLPGRFVPQPIVLATQTGTALAQLVQAPDPASRAAPTHGYGRQPWIAAAILATLLLVAAGAKRHAAPRHAAPVAQVTPAPPTIQPVAPPVPPPAVASAAPVSASPAPPPSPALPASPVPDAMGAEASPEPADDLPLEPDEPAAPAQVLRGRGQGFRRGLRNRRRGFGMRGLPAGQRQRK